MGMDLNIYAARNHEIFKHDGWWDNENVIEKYYSRKYWDMVYNCSFIPREYDGEFILLTKENLEEMISIGCEYRNYWDNYNDVPKLCELRDEFENLENNGFHLYLHYSY